MGMTFLSSRWDREVAALLAGEANQRDRVTLTDSMAICCFELLAGEGSVTELLWRTRDEYETSSHFRPQTLGDLSPKPYIRARY